MQVAFVVVAGLAAFARIQYAVLPIAFLAAALLVERGRVRRYWPTFALLALPVLGVVALGPSRVLGYYTQVPHANVPVLAALKWAAIDTMMLAYSAGWILIPGAIVGLALALVRPRTRIERAFGAMALFLAGGIFVEAAVYAARGATRYQERYLFTLLPLVALAFGLYVKRGWPHRLTVALVSLAMLLLSVRVPLSGFTAADNKQDSPFLFAVFRLEALLSVGTGTLVVAIAAGILSVLAVALVGRKHAAAIVLSLAGAACVLASLGSFVFDRANAANVRASHLPRDLTWIDRTGLKDVSLVQTLGAPRGRATEQLFWNKSVTRVTLLPGADATDAFGATPLDRHRRRAHGRRSRPDHRPDPVRVVRRTGRVHRREVRRARRQPRALQAGRDAAPLAPRRRSLHRRLARPRRAAHRLAGQERPHGRHADTPVLAPEGHPADTDDPHRSRPEAHGAGPERRLDAPSSSTRAASTRGCSTTAPRRTPISRTAARSASSSTRRSSSGARRSP